MAGHELEHANSVAEAESLPHDAHAFAQMGRTAMSHEGDGTGGYHFTEVEVVNVDPEHATAIAARERADQAVKAESKSDPKILGHIFKYPKVRPV